jgi:uncharacterized protein (DUF305 family)
VPDRKFHTAAADGARDVYDRSILNAPTPRIAVILFTVASAAACRTTAGDPHPSAEPTPQIVQPGAPGQPSHAIAADQSVDLSHVQATPADVKFMQGMISHHSQAVEMVELLKTHTTSPDMKLLGQRIELSQQDEIKMMQHWLSARGQTVPDPSAMRHMAGMSMPGMSMPMMPGMLTPEEMDRLAAANGTAFDRLFLEGMIKHHGGALTMVHDLFATPGAGQDSEIFAFASDVDADQRMEIDRMSAMLKELQ